MAGPRRILGEKGPVLVSWEYYTCVPAPLQAAGWVAICQGCAKGKLHYSFRITLGWTGLRCEMPHDWKQENVSKLCITLKLGLNNVSSSAGITVPRNFPNSKVVFKNMPYFETHRVVGVPFLWSLDMLRGTGGGRRCPGRQGLSAFREVRQDMFTLSGCVQYNILFSLL